jgi:hypothetical protein
MRKWFEWQQQHQRKNVDVEEVYTKRNILSEIEHIIKDIDNKMFAESIEVNAFYREHYTNKISKDYELNKKEVAEWINDPHLIKLLDEAGKLNMIFLPDHIANIYKKTLQNIFLIDQIEIKIHIQKPGQLFPLHYDRIKHKDHGVDRSKEENILRYMVFLKDQMPGQVFLLGEEFVKWRAGDVISWNQTNHPHGSANFGYYDRPALVVTGKKIDN